MLSVAAIAFAIVTIVFAPLAFLVGLFALDLQGFDKLRANGANNGDDNASDGNSKFDGGKMAGIFGKHSLPFQRITEV